MPTPPPREVSLPMQRRIEREKERAAVEKQQRSQYALNERMAKFKWRGFGDIVTPTVFTPK